MDTIIGGKKMSQQLLIQNGNTVYEPVVQDEITWTTERKGAAGKQEFKVVKDEIINFSVHFQLLFFYRIHPYRNLIYSLK